MKLSNSKRLAIIQWFNCMCVGHPIKGLKELADGKCFLKLQSRIDPLIAAVGENAKENYTLIEQFLNEYFETQIKGLINFKNCIKGQEFELAKLSILLLSASVKSTLSTNGNLDCLLHLNENLQESIRDCMSAVILGNANGNILAPDFSNVLSSYPVCADTPRRPSSSISARSSRKSKVQEDSVSSSPSSPLKVFWDSPQIAQQLKVKKMERELAELRQQLHREEDKFIDIEEEKKYHAEKLSEKDKEIIELKKMVEQLRGVEDMACDSNELKTTCESLRAEIESLKFKLLEADNLKLEVRHLALENEELSNVRNELQSKSEELNKIKNENFNERMNYQESQRSLNDCTERLKALLAENADLRQSVEESQTQYAELKILNDETLKDIRKLQDSPDLPKGESMDAIINEGNRELEQENSNLKNENISLKGDICCFSRKISELEKTLKEQEVVFSMQEKNLKANCEVIMNKLKNVMDKNKELESDLFATSSSLNSVQVEKQQICEFMQTTEFAREEIIQKQNEKIVDFKQNIDSLNNDKSAFLLEMHNLMLKNEALENELCANRAELVKKAENVQLLENQISLQSDTIHQKTEAFLNVQQELNYLMEKSVLSENNLEEKLKCTQSDLGTKNELIDELQREVSSLKNDCANSLMQLESLNVIIKEDKEKEAQNRKSYDDEYRRLEMLIQKQSEELISKEETISHNMCVNESILIHNKKLEDENQKLDERVTFLQEGHLEKSDLSLLLEKAEAKINFQACEICNLTKKLQDQEQSLTILKNPGLEMENLRNTIQALECSNAKAKILSENIQLLTCEKNCLVEENKQLKVQIQSVSDALNLKDIQEKENLNTFITQIENMKAEFEGRMKLWEQEKIMIKVENEFYVSSLNTETEKMKVSHDSKVKSLQEQISNNQLVNDELNLNFINHLETCSMNEKELENLKIAIKKRDSCKQELIDSLRDLDRELNIQKERNEQMEKEYSMCIEQRDSRIETLIKENMQGHKKVIETKDKQIDEYLQKIEALEETSVRAENQMRGEIRKLQNIMESIQTGLFCSGAECKLPECLTLQDLIATYEKIKSALLVVAAKKESRIQELEELVLVFESKYSTYEENTVGEIDEIKHILKNVQESNDELNAKNLSCTLKIEENEKELFVLSSKLSELSKENGQLKLDKQHAEDVLVTTVDNVKQELETEKKKMENINRDLNVKNEELNQEASSLTKKLKLLENENEKLKFGHMEKKKIFEEMKQLQMTVIASRARNEEFLGVLTGKNKKLKSDLESARELHSKTEKEKCEVETQLLGSNQKVLKLQSIVESYKKSHSFKQKQMQVAQKQLETAYQRIEKLEARIAQLESINIKYRQQVACFGKQEVKNKTRKRASENKSSPARELASSPDRPYFEMNSHLCTPHKKSVPFSENSDSIVPNLRRNINHTESYITSYTLNSTRNSFQDITDLSVAEMNITPVGGKSFLGNRFLPLDEEEDFLNHSSLADLKPAMPCLPPPTATRRISELQRRNTLCPPHLRTSYPVETQMHSASKYSEDALRAGHAVEDSNCVSFLGEHSKEYKKVSPKRKRSSSDTTPEQMKKVSKKGNLFETIKVSVSSPKPSSLRSRLQRTPSALKQFFNTRKGLENSVEKSKPKKGSRL